MTGTLGRNLLIHTGRGDEYIRDGVLGDAFIHEATHTSMDGPHLKSEGWQAAMVSDGIAISRYAADYPTVTQITNILDPYSTGACKRNVPCLKVPASSAARQSDLPPNPRIPPCTQRIIS